MENTKTAPIHTGTQKIKEEKTNKKDYRKPNLKLYGSISELVLMNAGENITDGGVTKFISNS